MSQTNFFDKEKMNIKKIVIIMLTSHIKSDIKLLNEYTSKKFSNKKLILIIVIFFLKII